MRDDQELMASLSISDFKVYMPAKNFELPGEQADFVERARHSHQRRETGGAPICLGGFPHRWKRRQTGLPTRGALASAHLAEHAVKGPDLVRAIAWRDQCGLHRLPPASIARRGR